MADLKPWPEESGEKDRGTGMEGDEDGSCGHDGEPHTAPSSWVGQHAGQGT